MSQQLAERIDRLEATCLRLERQARRWKLVGGLTLLGGMVLMISGAEQNTPSKMIVGEQFVLVDKGGVKRAALYMEDDRNPRLDFLGTNGKCALTLGVDSELTTGFSIFDSQGRTRVGVNFRSNQEAGLALFRDGEKKIGLGLNPDGEAVLGFCGREGRSQLQMRAQVEGTCDLVAFGGDKSKTFNLHIDGNGTPYLGLFDKDGRPLFRVPNPKVPLEK